MNIGFIGLGIMGSRMAAHLIDHGHTLKVYNRTQDKAAPLIDGGAQWAATPKEAALGCDVLFTMLAHPQAVLAMAMGEEGFLAGIPAGSLWIDSSTVHPSFSRSMAIEARIRQVRFMDAPVVGSKKQAESAVLTFLAGGDKKDFEEAVALFETMGKKWVHAGGHGMGIGMKLVFNHTLGVAMASFSEGMRLGESLGIPKEKLMDTLLSSPMTPPYLENKRANIEDGSYDTEFPFQWMQKDMHMVTLTAFENGLAMPTANAVKELFQLANQAGYGDADFSSVYEFLNPAKR